MSYSHLFTLIVLNNRIQGEIHGSNNSSCISCSVVVYRKLSSKDNKVYYKWYIRCYRNSAIYYNTNEYYYKNNNYSSIGFYGNHMAGKV